MLALSVNDVGLRFNRVSEKQALNILIRFTNLYLSYVRFVLPLRIAPVPCNLHERCTSILSQLPSHTQMYTQKSIVVVDFLVSQKIPK